MKKKPYHVCEFVPLAFLIADDVIAYSRKFKGSWTSSNASCVTSLYNTYNVIIWCYSNRAESNSPKKKQHLI